MACVSLPFGFRPCMATILNQTLAVVTVTQRRLGLLKDGFDSPKGLAYARTRVKLLQGRLR